MSRLLLALFTSLLAFSAATCAQNTPAAPATPTRQLTVEELFKKPALAKPILSRSGKYLAAVAPFKGRLNLLVINMETRKGDLLTSYENFDVVNVHWVGDERLIYSLGLYDAPTGPSSVDGGGLFVVGRIATFCPFTFARPTVHITRCKRWVCSHILAMCLGYKS